MFGRGVVFAIAGTAALVCVTLSGCSGGNSGSPSSAAPNASTSTAVSASDPVKVVVDGQDQNPHGPVTCDNSLDTVTFITIGQKNDHVFATVTNDNPPQVGMLGLGEINGVPFGYGKGTGHGSAQVVKDGKTYRITGTAVGGSERAPVTKPFGMDVLCP
ncbi:MAG: lipoprotein LpqH [Candidatus Sericytochromatia bacterium]